jgi:hypothetical protein
VCCWFRAAGPYSWTVPAANCERCLLRIAAANNTALPDGCTVSDGYADGADTQARDRGAGLYSLQGSPLVRNCTFVANSILWGNGRMSQSSYDELVQVSSEIDGEPVMDLARYRGQSLTYMLMLPPGNRYDPLPADTYGPAFDEGYYLMLAPLPVGEHTIHCHATRLGFFGDCHQDITYNLTVVPAGQCK